MNISYFEDVGLTVQRFYNISLDPFNDKQLTRNVFSLHAALHASSHQILLHSCKACSSILAYFCSCHASCAKALVATGNALRYV